MHPPATPPHDLPDAASVARDVIADLGQVSDEVLTRAERNGLYLAWTVLSMLEAEAEPSHPGSAWGLSHPEECSLGPHRGPEGPNEDIAQCPQCWSVSWALRPHGETFGEHLVDCSLPARHESHCEPGGTGHPRAALIRG